MELPPAQLGNFACPRLDELLVPSLRIENLEARTGSTHHFETCSRHVLHCCPVLSKQVEQSTHLPLCLFGPSAGLEWEGERFKECQRAADAICLSGMQGRGSLEGFKGPREVGR